MRFVLLAFVIVLGGCVPHSSGLPRHFAVIDKSFLDEMRHHPSAGLWHEHYHELIYLVGIGDADATEAAFSMFSIQDDCGYGDLVKKIMVPLYENDVEDFWNHLERVDIETAVAILFCLDGEYPLDWYTERPAFLEGHPEIRKAYLRASAERGMDMLSSCEIHYFLDGAGGSDILEHAEVIDFVREAGADIPRILVEHLADQEPAAAVAGGERVSLGFVCFDLLCTIVEGNEIWFDDTCGDDGIGACVRAEYSIPMFPRDEDLKRLPEIQANWKRLLEYGELKFTSDIAALSEPARVAALERFVHAGGEAELLAGFYELRRYRADRDSYRAVMAEVERHSRDDWPEGMRYGQLYCDALRYVWNDYACREKLLALFKAGAGFSYRRRLAQVIAEKQATEYALLIYEAMLEEEIDWVLDCYSGSLAMLYPQDGFPLDESPDRKMHMIRHWAEALWRSGAIPAADEK